jgi:ADP-ribosylation factor-like protein 6
MGLLDKLGSLLKSKKDAQILLVGLDNSGKSTIINCLKPADLKLSNIQATVGFNTEKLVSKSMNLTIYDMSGNNRYRNLWEHYYREVDAIIFVIDVSDKMRVVVAKEEIDLMLNNAELKARNIPILVFANKIDVKNGATVGEIKCELELDRVRNKKCEIYGSNALSGEGIDKGFEWLVQMINSA